MSWKVTSFVSGIRNPAEVRISETVQIGPESCPTSCKMDAQSLSWRYSGRGVALTKPPPPCSSGVEYGYSYTSSSSLFLLAMLRKVPYILASFINAESKFPQ